MASIIRLQNKDGSVSYQAQVRIKRGGKLLLNESRSFLAAGVGIRAEAQAKRLAEEWAELLTEKMREQGAIAQRKLKGLTLKDLIDKYIEFFEKDKHLWASKRSVLNVLARSPMADVAILELTADKIIDYVRHRRSFGVQPQSIQQDIIYLGCVLKEAKLFAKLDVDIAQYSLANEYLKEKGMISGSVERERRLQDSELGMILAGAKATEHFRQIPIADLVRFAIETTMRRSEITRLQWSDLDEKNRTILIRDRKDPKKKIGNDQTVPLLGTSLSIIQAQPRTSEFIFPYKSESVGVAFRGIVRKAGILDLHFHDLRHEGISRLFEQGYQIQEVALVSGHKSWKNLKRYTQLRAVDLHRDILPVVVMEGRGDRR
jgi:integrase